MKALLVGIAVILALAYVVIDDDGIAHSFWQKLDAREGAYPSEAFDKEKVVSLGVADQAQAFKDKYLPNLSKRYWIIRYAFLLGNYPYCREMCDQALLRYKDSVLGQEEKYQDLAFYRARCLEEKTGDPKFSEARAAYSQFLEQYPNHPLAIQAKQRLGELDLLGK